MSLAAPIPGDFNNCGNVSDRAYSAVKPPPYLEVAAAVPGSDSRERLRADLVNVFLDCFHPNWDGFGAQQVSPDAFQIAQDFIRNLPSSFPSPLVSADSDGCITFEWRASPRRIVLVSVHPDYRIDYAALFGAAKTYGSEPFFGKLPGGFYDLVRRVYQS